MLSLFYDLETSTSLPLGQILNFCFMLVEEDFSIVEEFSDRVQLSCLELPAPGAILANRVNVEEHAAAELMSEPKAMGEIAEFLTRALEKAGGSIALIGYNSMRFDLPYLRTSLIRNGFYPYPNGLLHRDLLHAVRRLRMTDPRFPRCVVQREGEERLELSLERVSTELGLLEGAQLHESSADVALTVALARTLYQRFGFDVRRVESFDPYPINKPLKCGVVLWQLRPPYDAPSKRANRHPMMLLDVSAAQSLWVDLERFEQGAGRGSIRWMNARSSEFVSDGEVEPSERWRDACDRAQREFSGLKATEFFSRSQCDIERDIYRLDYEGCNALFAVMRGARKQKSLPCDDARELFLRYRLRAYQWGGPHDPRASEELRKYALYRYGGLANIEKSEPLAQYEEGADPRHFHPTFREMVHEAESAMATGSPEDVALLEALLRYYRSCRIYQVAGEELERTTIRPALKSAEGQADS